MTPDPDTDPDRDSDPDTDPDRDSDPDTDPDHDPATDSEGRDATPTYHVDGELVPAGEATVSVRDRGFMYGDAAFETLRAYGGEVFEWRAHVERLQRTCDALGLDHGLSDADLRVRVAETMQANDFEDAYVRLSVTRGVQPGKLTPSPEVDPTVVVIVEELPRGGVDGDDVWDGPAAVQTVTTRRIPDAAVPAGAKTHNYLNGILARNELADGADEALLRDTEGFVAEGATSNVFFVDDEGLKTPSLDGPVLPGVTRSVVADLARDADIPVHADRYGPAEVRDADEAFLTNTTWEVRPIGSLDGVELGAGPVTKLLARSFDQLVERRHY